MLLNSVDSGRYLSLHEFPPTNHILTLGCDSHCLRHWTQFRHLLSPSVKNAFHYPVSELDVRLATVQHPSFKVLTKSVLSLPRSDTCSGDRPFPPYRSLDTCYPVYPVFETCSSCSRTRPKPVCRPICRICQVFPPSMHQDVVMLLD